MGGVERARQRAAFHGGEVGATSELGIGTTVRLSLSLEGAAGFVGESVAAMFGGTHAP